MFLYEKSRRFNKICWYFYFFDTARPRNLLDSFIFFSRVQTFFWFTLVTTFSGRKRCWKKWKNLHVNFVVASRALLAPSIHSTCPMLIRGHTTKKGGCWYSRKVWRDNKIDHGSDQLLAPHSLSSLLYFRGQVSHAPPTDRTRWGYIKNAVGHRAYKPSFVWIFKKNQEDFGIQTCVYTLHCSFDWIIQSFLLDLFFILIF